MTTRFGLKITIVCMHMIVYMYSHTTVTSPYDKVIDYIIHIVWVSQKQVLLRLVVSTSF